MVLVYFKHKLHGFYMDSIKNGWPLFLSKLANFIEQDYKNKTKKTISVTVQKITNVAMQTNGHDCGIYVCCNAEELTRTGQIKTKSIDADFARKKIMYELCAQRLTDHDLQ